MNKTARLYYCVSCHRQTLICSECDRGNIYCAADCATQARAQSVRRANQRYQKSHRGRIKHAARQQQYRARQNQKVTHQGSLKQTDESPLNSPDKPKKAGLHCHFCGNPVTEFVRSNYVNHDWRDKKRQNGLHRLRL